MVEEPIEEILMVEDDRGFVSSFLCRSRCDNDVRPPLTYCSAVVSS